LKAVRVGEPGTVTVADVPEPRLHGPQDAMVKVTAAAICGADLFPIHGMTPGFDDATVLATKAVLYP
jgi:alcohol dehydrogenase